MGIKIIIKNKKAGFDFFLEERIEAGLCLTGTEVKSLRLGKVNMNDCYVSIDQHFEAWIYNLTIAHYDFGNIHNHPETRKRKLLLHKDQIKKIHYAMKTQGQTLVPTALYFKDSRVKCEIALANGKKNHDKRDSIAKKDVDRQLRQATKNASKAGY
jgi:SsrA-binding protein